MKFYQIIFVLAVLFGCKPTKEGTKTDNTQTVMTDSAVELSAPTKIFLNDLKKEKDLTEVSESFRSKYLIKEIDGVNYISAFITVSSDFKVQPLNELGVKTNPKVGDRISVLVPIEAINEVLTINDISYFEIAIKGSLK